MDKEEILKKLEEVNKDLSQEDRIKLLEKIKETLYEANKGLSSLNSEVKTEIGK